MDSSWHGPNFFGYSLSMLDFRVTPERSVERDGLEFILGAYAHTNFDQSTHKYTTYIWLVLLYLYHCLLWPHLTVQFRRLPVCCKPHEIHKAPYNMGSIPSGSPPTTYNGALFTSYVTTCWGRGINKQGTWHKGTHQRTCSWKFFYYVSSAGRWAVTQSEAIYAYPYT